jgi:hypothetical protein
MRKLLILVSAVALVVAFTLPAAAEVSFYGNVRMMTFWESHDPDVAGQDTWSDLLWDMDIGSSRFGARFKHDSVGANVEIRPRVKATSTTTGDFVRHFNGTWDFGGGTLLVGQAWSETFSCVSSSICEGGLSGGRGDTYGSLRIPQVAVHIGSLHIAGASPTKADLVDGGRSTTSIPKIEASYGLKAGPAAIKIYGGFNSSEEEVGTTTYDYSGMLLGANAVMGFGAAKLGINLYMANNPKLYGEVGSTAQANTITGTEVNDVDTLGFLVDFNYKLSPTMNIYAGYGQAVSELDVPGTDENTSSYMYVGLPITLAKGVTLTPEIAITTDEHDTGAATTPAPSVTYYGAYWQINF